MRAFVVVPARDEQDRIGACLQALAAQPEAAAGQLQAVVVLDACRDDTARVVARAPSSLAVHVVAGPGAGPGRARRAGMCVARRLARDEAALLLSTDADTRVDHDWVAAQIGAVRTQDAQAIGGRIVLDEAESRALAPGVVAARSHAAVARLERVRAFAPDAEHHQFSGASLALTVDAYDRVGGIPDVPTLEDEALEGALRSAGIPIRYLSAVRVTTSARTDGRARHGLADALAAWDRELTAAAR